MSGGWQGSDRRAELPADWPQIRASVLARDGHRCRWANSGERCTEQATDVDHISNPNDHSAGNLQALCSWHHRRKTSTEGNRSPNRVKVSELRNSEDHPGLIS